MFSSLVLVITEQVTFKHFLFCMEITLAQGAPFSSFRSPSRYTSFDMSHMAPQNGEYYTIVFGL